jgi:hypothetical protein
MPVLGDPGVGARGGVGDGPAARPDLLSVDDEVVAAVMARPEAGGRSRRSAPAERPALGGQDLPA